MTLVFRIWYRLLRLFSSMQYRFFRRFTAAGVAVGIATFVAAMMGPDTDNNRAYQGFALSFFTLMAALAYTWPLKGVFAVHRHLPRFGTVGNPLSYSITIRNNSREPQLGLTVMEALADPRPAFPDWLMVQLAEERESFRVSKRRRPNSYRLANVREAPVPPIPPGQETQAKIELTPLRRGILRFTAVSLARTDPLGLCRSFRHVPLLQTTVILPKRYPLPPIPMPGFMKYQEGGVAMASHVGQSEEFVSLREYRYGDPMRHIHWRSWAKLGKPVVKEFEDEFFVRHALVLDTFADQPHSEVFEEAVSVAASFACTLETQESLLDLLFVGPQAFCFTAGRGLAHADQMLEVLAGVRPCLDRKLEELSNLILEHAASLTGCIFVLLDWDEPRREMVKRLGALGVPLMVFVITDARSRRRILPEPGMEKFYVLEAGNIERGLATIK